MSQKERLWLFVLHRVKQGQLSLKSVAEQSDDGHNSDYILDPPYLFIAIAKHLDSTHGNVASDCKERVIHFILS